MIKDLGYETVSALDCFSSCLFSYLNYLHIDIPQYEAFIVGNGLEITVNYGVKDYITTNQKVITVYEKAMELYGIPLVSGNCKEDPKAFLIQCMKENRMLMLKLSSGMINYNDVFAKNTSIGHFINAIGLDSQEEQVYISDGFIPTRVLSKFEGWISIEELFSNWKTKDCTYTELQITAYTKEQIVNRVCSLDVNRIVKQQLTKYVNGTYMESEGLYFGQSAVVQFAEHVLSYVEYEADDLEKRIYDEIYHFKMFGFFIGKRAITQMLHMRKDCNPYYAKHADDLVSDWDKIMLALLKLKIRRSEKDLCKLKDRILTLNEEECRFYETLVRES